LIGAIWQFLGRWRHALAMAAVLALTIHPAVAAAADPTCDEVRGQPAADDAENLVELTTNTKRPTFRLPLDDKSEVADTISVPRKSGGSVGRDPGDVSATVLEGLHDADGRKMDGDLRAAAAPSSSGGSVVLEGCVAEAGTFTAGTYDGVVEIFGPRIGTYSYPVSVTTKWPSWFAWLLLVAAILVGIAVAGFFMGSFSFGDIASKRRRFAARVLGVVASVAGGVLTFYGTYAVNDTWGSDAKGEISALFVAGFTAAVAGPVIARRIIKGSLAAPAEGQRVAPEQMPTGAPQG